MEKDNLSNRLHFICLLHCLYWFTICFILCLFITFVCMFPCLSITVKYWFRLICLLFVQHWHSVANGQWGYSTVQHVPICLCSLLAANSQFSITIGQKMPLTGCDNANNVRNTTCADSMGGPNVQSLYCDIGFVCFFVFTWYLIL